jgi:hypothetical protein
MSDPKKFKPYYIIGAISKKTNKIREQRLSTEMERMKRPMDLTSAKERAKNFADSLNESNTLMANDWKPLLFLQHTETQRLPVEV